MHSATAARFSPAVEEPLGTSETSLSVTHLAPGLSTKAARLGLVSIKCKRFYDVATCLLGTASITSSVSAFSGV